MTLVRRESTPVSEGQTIIRSHYLAEPPPIAGVARPATTVTQEVIVVGPGVNYDANRGVGAPAWTPSQAALSAAVSEPGVAFKSAQSPLEVSLPDTAAGPLLVSKNGRALACRFVGANPVAPLKTDDHTARYSNVFPDTDLEWTVGNGCLKETLILRSRQSPSEFSFVLATNDLVPLVQKGASYVPVSTVAAGGQSAAVGGPILLALANDTTKRRMLIPQPVIADSSGRKRSRLDCTISQPAPGTFQLTACIPDRFLADGSLQYPLLLDPSFINVTDDSVKTFHAGNTYFISSPIQYYEGLIRIEANAFLKFAPSGAGYASLTVDGSAWVSVEGTPYNYAYFTSGYDDSLGADTDGDGLPLGEGQPAPGNYPYAIQVCAPYSPSPAGFIRYGKFAYGATGVYIGAPAPGPEHLYVRVMDCVFRNEYTPISVECDTNSVDCEVRNCLFVGVGPGWGTAVMYSSSDRGPHTLALYNCTFSGFYDGVGITDDCSDSYFTVGNSVFTNCNYAVTGTWPSESNYSINYNGLANMGGESYVDPPELPVGGSVWTEAAPFDTNANGSFYLKTTSVFRDKGSLLAAQVALSSKTTIAATGSLIKTQDIAAPETWTPIARDTGTVDLGYHYDPVDVIIEPIEDPQQCPLFPIVKVKGANATLRVNPGVVVAFSHLTHNLIGFNVSRFSGMRVTDNASISAVGQGNARILFSSTAATGDAIGHPDNMDLVPFNWYLVAVQLARGGSDPAPGSELRHCDFSWAFSAVEMSPWWTAQQLPAAIPIEGCRFSYCYDGVGIYQSSAPNAKIVLDVRNCLFHHLSHNGVSTPGGTTYDRVTVENCTFTTIPACGVFFQSYTTLRNLIFYQCGQAWGFGYQSPGYLLESCYGDDAWESDPKFDAGTPPDPDINKRYFLNQVLSACVDTGADIPNATDKPSTSTAHDGGPDFAPMDIGYHGPSAPVIWDSRHNNKVTEVSGGEWTSFPRPWQKKDGTLLCTYSDTLGEVSGNILYIKSRIPLKWSLDYGKTWELSSAFIDEIPQAGWDEYETDDWGLTWHNYSDPTVYEFEPFVIELSNGDLLCSFVRFTYNEVTYPTDEKNWEYTDFEVRIKKWNPVLSTWQDFGPGYVQHDQPASCPYSQRGNKWSWTLWESTLLELPRDPAQPNVIKLVCFFTRYPFKVSYLQDRTKMENGQLVEDVWPSATDFVSHQGAVVTDYIAARVMTLDLNGILIDTWPPTSSPPIIVACHPDPGPWILGTWPGSVTGYLDPWPTIHTGMCNAVVLKDKILAVFEDGKNDPGDPYHLRVSSVASMGTSGRVWDMPSGNVYPKVYEPAVADALARRSASGPNIARLSDGRLICAFMTDEDSPDPQRDNFDAYSDIKAVVSDDYGAGWSPFSVSVATQRYQTPKRSASWSGLCRLHDDSLLCAFTDGAWGDLAPWDSVKCTTGTLPQDLPLVDHFEHLDMEGSPFKWALLPGWQLTAAPNHGNVLKLASGSPDAMARRGGNSWTNYVLQADVKLESSPAWAGVCVRVAEVDTWPGDYASYHCFIDSNTNPPKFGLRYHRYFQNAWQWDTPPAPYQDVSLTGFDSSIWHTMKVQVVGDQVECWLDETWHFTASSAFYVGWGAVGFRVRQGSALFDDIMVSGFGY